MRKVVSAVLFLLVLTGCEDVVQVDAPTEPPRLIVDALIKIDENEAFQTARIRVALTSSFFGTTPVTDLEQITITNVDMESTFENPNTIILLETEPGVYEMGKNTTFFSEGELILQINHSNRRFFARTRFVPTVSIDNLEQGTGTLFEGDETEVIITFTDNGDRDDFYVFDLDFDEYLVTEDEFYQGRQFQFSYFYDNNLKPGQEVGISILGADEGFYNYMNQLVQQGGDLMGPFATPAATVRGNIFDVTELDNMEVFDNVDTPDNFALGYFAVVQENTAQIVIE